MTEERNLRDVEGGAVTVTGGRTLAYREFGSPTGPVVLYFHGIPSSSLDVHMFRGPEVATALGIRLVAVDRPGCGGSTFQPGRTLLHWPDDIRELTTRLGIERFGVLGWSGGGPHALACARRLPRLVHRCTVVSSVAPLRLARYASAMSRQSRTFFRSNASAPPLGRLLDALMLLGARRRPAEFLRRSEAALPPVDRRVLQSPDVAQAYLAAIVDCFRSGTAGGGRDAAIAARRWPFDLAAIHGPVHIWHGGRDTDSPDAAALWLQAAIPTSSLHLLADEGHLSLVTAHLPAILTTLVDGT